MSFISIDPSNGRQLRRYRAASPGQIEKALDRARRAFPAWRARTVADRAGCVQAIGAVLRRRSEDLSRLATGEMGKPIAQSREEVEKCAKLCDYYSRRASGFLADERPAGAPAGAYVRFEPLGAILAIMPWNFPYWQVLRAAIPAMAAGNVVLLKHAPNVSGCALAIDDLFASAGFPEGAFQTLLLSNEHVPGVIADSRIHGITLTGSARAGCSVGALAGRAMKKAVFELGGNDAYLVLEDADLDRAAEICAASRLLNSGQSCICAKRFIVVRSVRREFEEKFASRLAARAVGDPRDSSTQVGPLARADLRDRLDRQVRASIRAGARARLGGEARAGAGFFYEPTLLTEVAPGMPAYSEELFGPVASLIAVPSEAAAVRIANDSIYGLGAGIFSSDRHRARKIAAQIQAGSVSINDFVRSDPSLPFGGVKLSGHGRELGSFGMREFVNIKTVSAV
jgi:succinate-semialdehyde dehydrogenase/glutarate-semialdehyde dehydrogenase